MRVVFLKLVGKLACNARLPAYIFCCKELTKKELQTNEDKRIVALTSS